MQCCRSHGVGCSRNSNSIPGLGTSIFNRCSLKDKKNKKPIAFYVWMRYVNLHVSLWDHWVGFIIPLGSSWDSCFILSSIHEGLFSRAIQFSRGKNLRSPNWLHMQCRQDGDKGIDINHSQTKTFNNNLYLF